jgi:RNA-directed DNA polymerase
MLDVAFDGCGLLAERGRRHAKTGLFYARFMNDGVVLAPTHWKLRATIRLVNQTLVALKVQQLPDKTFVGRVGRGFDFLGYTFSTVGLTGMARKTVVGCVERINQLYERGADAVRI